MHAEKMGTQVSRFGLSVIWRSFFSRNKVYHLSYGFLLMGLLWTCSEETPFPSQVSLTKEKKPLHSGFSPGDNPLDIGGTTPPISPAPMRPTLDPNVDLSDVLADLSLDRHMSDLEIVKDHEDASMQLIEERDVKYLSDRWGQIEWSNGENKGTRGPLCLFGKNYSTYYRRGQGQMTDNNRVILYLGPGGACFDAYTCIMPRDLSATGEGLASSEAHPPYTFGDVILSEGEGISPLRDWPVVFAPYCDGSVFAGDNDVLYEVPAPLAGAGTYPVQHRGLQNMSSAVATIKRKFSTAPKEIVVLGSSAGGFGIIAALGLLRVSFPDVDIVAFSDSSPLIMSPQARVATKRIFENWALAKQIPACAGCDGPHFYPVLSFYLEKDPRLKRIGIAGWKRDRVMALYNLFDFSSINTFLMGEDGTPVVDGEVSSSDIGTLSFIFSLLYAGGEPPPGVDAFQKVFLEESEKVAQVAPDRVKRFILNGHHHMMLYFGPPASFANPSIGGQKAYDWLNQLITGDPAWRDFIEEDPVK